MRYASKQLVEAPENDAVSLDEVKAYRRVGSTTIHDDILTACLSAAIEHTETACARALISQKWDIFFDAFCGSTIELPLGRLLGVLEFEISLADGSTISYTTDEDGENLLDEDGATIAHIDKSADVGGRIVLAFGRVWPTAILRTSRAIRVRIQVGYGEAASDVPSNLKAYIQLFCGDLFEHRETIETGLGQTLLELPIAKYLLANHRIY